MLDLAQIQHHNRHGKRKTYGLFQLCFHFSKVAFSLGKTELPLNFNALVLVEICLPLVALFILFRSAQCRSAEPDSMQLAIAEVFSISVDLIRQHTLRILSFAGSVPLYGFNQFRGFIVGVE